MCIKLKFPNVALTLNNLGFDGFHYTTPISTVLDKICELESYGYYESFLPHFA